MRKNICDFCGLTETKANPIIQGEQATICYSCATSATEIMSEHVQKNTKNTKKIEETPTIDIKSPKELKEFLDGYVVGQHKAKKVFVRGRL